MIRPIGIQNTDLCHGRIAFLFISEIILDMLEVLKCHGEVQRSVQLLQISSAISLNPSKIFTSSGSGNTVTSVSGFSRPVSRESTGLMQ